jgi:autophagy-related protein 13
MRCGAFVDASRIKQFTEDDFSLPETPPFSWLLRKTKEEMSVQDDQTVSPVTTPTEGELVALKAVETATTTTAQAQPNTANNNNANVKSFESQSPKAEGYLTGTSPTSLLSESKRPSRWATQAGDEDEKLLKELVSDRCCV